EEAKHLEVAGRLWAAMVEAGGKRDSRLITLGGGTVGDLGGFVAGCFLRGIEYAQLPTTLLAQVDAAVGGKTGIDWGGTKNSVGLFHHPAMVISDTSFLETLPKEELRSALAEVVKTAILLDPLLLETVENRLDLLIEGDAKALEPVVLATARAKARLVERDPREAGDRRLLNFGHTLGHALEAALGYQGLRHGEAVAYGMLFALRLALGRGLEPAVARRCRQLLRRFDLPPLPPMDPEAVLAAVAKDKKGREGGLTWVLPAALGEGVMVDDFETSRIAEEVRAFFDDPWSDGE
ncbi:MAG: 3-dehydroquinate synthase, partial [Acidobacteria bacterium]|nr:3-dehydroquinate synthase [Acidobacteriota bacterium]